MTRNISLPRELHDFVAARVASRRYQSASEVVREALRLLEQRDLYRQEAIQGLRHHIELGLKQIADGDVHDGEETFKQLMQQSLRRK